MTTFRDELIRAVFELERDLTWWTTLEPGYREQGLDTAAITSRRTAFNQQEEKRNWPRWQDEATRFSNAVLDDMRMDCIDRLDALGLLRWKQDRASDRERLQQVLGAPDRQEKRQERSKDQGRAM